MQAELHNIVKDHLQNNDMAGLLRILRKKQPVDVAGVFRELQPEEKILLFSRLNRERAADVLEEMDAHSLSDLLEEIDDKKLAHIIPLMADDDATDVLQELSESRKENVLVLMEEEESQDLEELLQYGGETAGGIMSKEFVSLRPDETVADAIVRIRKRTDKDEPVYTIFITDVQDHLLGYLKPKDIIINRPSTRISRIYNRDVISANVETDQEEVARLASRYNLLSVPIVDKRKKLVGFVTIDDIVDVIQDENTEDMLKMAGTDDAELVSNSIFRIARIRLPWLMTSLVGSLAAAVIIGLFKDTLERMVILASFIPVITGMGGNVGVQSSVITIRGIATGRLKSIQIGRELFREIRVGIIMGVIVGAVIGLFAHFWNGNAMLGVAIGLAMVLAITVAAATGTIMPFFLKFVLRTDPAVAAGPFVTTANDITGIIVYLLLAKLLISRIAG